MSRKGKKGKNHRVDSPLTDITGNIRNNLRPDG